MNPIPDPASFRDPDGFVFEWSGNYYRVVHKNYADTWEKVWASGLLQELIAEKKMPALEVQDLSDFSLDKEKVYKIYKVQRVPVISYPPEWSFFHFKKAALLTLSIQRRALEKGLSLKDASAYNIQFTGREAMFIDAFSFELTKEAQPWQAYGQFCRHFLAPLLLWNYGIPEPQSFFLAHLDGIPLGHCARLLPARSGLNLFVFTHLHLHARMERKHAGDRKLNLKLGAYSKQKQLKLLEHLEMGIKELELPLSKSTWTDYYESCSYTETELIVKQDFVKRHCQNLKGKLCLDLGANTGMFSLLAAEHFDLVLACDNDEEVLKSIRRKKRENILTLRIDLGNPTPAFGWNSKERRSFKERVATNELTLALALVHHLCIAGNIPLPSLAEFFAEISGNLIIEFVPKEDEQVQRLLVSRQDIFNEYSRSYFEQAFSPYYHFKEILELRGSGRVLYFMSRK